MERISKPVKKDKISLLHIKEGSCTCERQSHIYKMTKGRKKGKTRNGQPHVLADAMHGPPWPTTAAHPPARSKEIRHTVQHFDTMSYHNKYWDMSCHILRRCHTIPRFGIMSKLAWDYVKPYHIWGIMSHQCRTILPGTFFTSSYLCLHEQLQHILQLVQEEDLFRATAPWPEPYQPLNRTAAGTAAATATQTKHRAQRTHILSRAPYQHNINILRQRARERQQ